MNVDEAELVSSFCNALGWPGVMRRERVEGGRVIHWYESIISQHDHNMEVFQVNVMPRLSGCMFVERLAIRSGFYKFELADDGSDVLDVARRLSPLWHRNWFVTRRNAKCHLKMFPEHKIVTKWPGEYGEVLRPGYLR